MHKYTYFVIAACSQYKMVPTAFPTPLDSFTGFFNLKGNPNENHIICYKSKKNYSRILQFGHILPYMFVIMCITKFLPKKFFCIF